MVFKKKDQAGAALPNLDFGIQADPADTLDHVVPDIEVQGLRRGRHRRRLLLLNGQRGIINDTPVCQRTAGDIQAHTIVLH